MAVKKDLSTAKSYSQLQQELDSVTTQLENGDVSIDEALKLYENGLKLVAELEKQLSRAENCIIELKNNYKVED